MVSNVECLLGCLMVSGLICCCHTCDPFCEPSCAPSRSRAYMPTLYYGVTSLEVEQADKQAENEEGEETEEEAVSGVPQGDEPDGRDDFDDNSSGPSAGIALNGFALMLQNIYYHYLPKGKLPLAPNDPVSAAKVTDSTEEKLLPPSRLAMTR